MHKFKYLGNVLTDDRNCDIKIGSFIPIITYYFHRINGEYEERKKNFTRNKQNHS